MPTVWITNKSGHDFSDARRFGDLQFLTEGHIKAVAVNSLYRELAEKMQESQEDDYIVLTGMPILSAILCSIFAYKHGKINLLIFKDGRYLERNIVIGELI